MLRCLDQSHGRIVKKSKRPRYKVHVGNEVGVENGDEVRRIGQRSKRRQAGVYIAGFGVIVVRPRMIVNAQPLAHLAQPGPALVVEHADPQRWIVRRHCTDNRALQDGRFLVVSCNQDVDARWRGLSPPGQVGIGLAATVQCPRHDDRGYGARDQRHRFEREEQPRDPRVDRKIEFGDGFVETPDDVAPSQQNHRSEDEHAYRLGMRPEHR